MISKKYGYGFSEYVSLSTTLPSLDNYQPQNTPSVDEVNLGASYNKGGKGGISASYTIKHNQLSITSQCSTPKKLYSIAHDYKPYIAQLWQNNKYLANESIQMGIAEFESSNSTVRFVVNYDARFGVATDASASPASIIANYVRSTKYARSYSFTISK